MPARFHECATDFVLRCDDETSPHPWRAPEILGQNFVVERFFGKLPGILLLPLAVGRHAALR
jgi:hypothetical protein